MSRSTFPELGTHRLLLRQLGEGDSEFIYILRTDPRVNQFVVRKTPKNPEDASNFIRKINKGIKKGRWMYWALVPKENALPIGTICLWNFSEDNQVAEVGFDLYPDYQGKGYMTEALGAVVEFGFKSLGVKKIDAYAHPENIPSHSLLLKNGFLQKPSGLEPLLHPMKVFELLSNNPVDQSR